MAAPEHVPTEPQQIVRSYSSPPWRPEPWFADRPGELDGLAQPSGDQLGSPGPDQGYALLLAARFKGQLRLQEGESEADALAGAVAIATKRSGALGRAPVLHDIRVGLLLWGFLDATVAPDLVAIRREWFEEVHLPMHYNELRRIADAVPEDLLRLPHQAIEQRYRADWRSCLDLT
jgi:hypothetical protein